MISIVKERNLDENESGKQENSQMDARVENARDQLHVTLHYMITHRADADGAGCLVVLNAILSRYGFGEGYPNQCHVLLARTAENSGRTTDVALCKAIEDINDIVNSDAGGIGENMIVATPPFSGWIKDISVLDDDIDVWKEINQRNDAAVGVRIPIDNVVLYVTDLSTSTASDDDPNSMHRQYNLLSDQMALHGIKVYLVHIDHHPSNPYIGRDVFDENAIIRIEPDLYKNDKIYTGDMECHRSATWLLAETVISKKILPNVFTIPRDSILSNSAQYTWLLKMAHEISVHDTFAFKDKDFCNSSVGDICVRDIYAQYYRNVGMKLFLRRCLDTLYQAQKDVNYGTLPPNNPYGIIGVYGSQDLEVMQMITESSTAKAVSQIFPAWAIYQNSSFPIGVAVGNYDTTPMSVKFFADTLHDAEPIPEVLLVITIQSPEQGVFSMRSRGNIDVGTLCKKLGGGGHHNSAGVTFDGKDKWLTVIDYLTRAIHGGGINFDTLLSTLK